LPPSSHLRRVAGASGAGSIGLGAGAWQPTLQNVQSPQTDINKYNKSAKDSTSGFLMRKIANVCWVALGCENNAKRKKLVACKFMLGVRFVDPCSAGHRAQEKGHFVDAWKLWPRPLSSVSFLTIYHSIFMPCSGNNRPSRSNKLPGLFRGPSRGFKVDFINSMPPCVLLCLQFSRV